MVIFVLPAKKDLPSEKELPSEKALLVSIA
jgi:hypothetical protein